MSNPLTALAATLDDAIRVHIFSQPRAKAFALAAYADAEDSGEGQIFDLALHHVHESRLRRMLEAHRDDERRHAQVLRERRDQLGLEVLEVPERLALVDRLSEAAGGVLDTPMNTDEQVAAAYALLYVIEERALDEFQRSGTALARAGDVQTSDLFLSIRKDEARHLRYCEAVGMAYDKDGFWRRVNEMRRVELRVYGDQQRQWTRHQLDSGYLRLPPLLDLAVRASTALTGWLGVEALPPQVDDVRPRVAAAAA